MKENKSNMYVDSKKQWNVIVGCRFSCIYCQRSFQAQMKRQKHHCMRCYTYEPHFHPERLNMKLPRTYGDEFIWCCSSSDISFAKWYWIEQILEVVRDKKNRTFFFQTKDPSCFHKYQFPDNVLLGITLESNRDYRGYSRAPLMTKRWLEFGSLVFPRKVITIEPIMDFDFDPFVKMIKSIRPERVYIGYDTKKSNLLEPDLQKTMKLVKKLSKFTKVKTKYMKNNE